MCEHLFKWEKPALVCSLSEDIRCVEKEYSLCVCVRVLQAPYLMLHAGQEPLCVLRV